MFPSAARKFAMFLWTNQLRQEKDKTTVKSKLVRKPLRASTLLLSGSIVATFHSLSQKRKVGDGAH